MNFVRGLDTWLCPVSVQVLEIVDKTLVLEVATLGQEVQVVGVGQTLDEFKLNLKPGGKEEEICNTVNQYP